MLKINSIEKTFNPGTINEKKALDKVSLHLNPGDFVTIIGGNGAGKSTLMNAITGVWPVDNGSIILDGVNVTGLPEYKRAKFIGRVFQDPMMGTAPDMQIIENLALAYRRGKKRTLKWGITKKEKEMFHEKLKILGLGLEDRMTSKVGLLSGGQRQRVAICRALVTNPKLIVADEPTGNLDSKNSHEILSLFKELNEKEGVSILMVTHDSKIASYSSKLLYIKDGIIDRTIERKGLSQKEYFYKIVDINSSESQELFE